MKKEPENIEAKNENFLNHFLAEKIHEFKPTKFNIRFTIISMVFTALIFGANIESISDFIWFIYIVYLIFEFGYEVDKRFKVIGNIFFMMRLVCGAYLGCGIVLLMDFIVHWKIYRLKGLHYTLDFFNPVIMMKEYSSNNLAALGIGAGIIFAFLFDIIMYYYKTGKEE